MSATTARQSAYRVVDSAPGTARGITASSEIPGPLWELIALAFPELDGSEFRTLTLLSLIRELDGTLTKRQRKLLGELVSVGREQ